MTDQSPDVRAAQATSDDEWLLELATAIADGRAIEWPALESASTDEQRSFIPCLRAVAALPGVSRDSRIAKSATSPADASPDMTDAPSTARPSRWGSLEIRERVGQGRYGTVYRAWDPALEREVALKLLPHGSGQDAAESSAVVAEGRLMARVRHPNVVAIYGAQRIDGQTGLWMEFVHGRTLAEDLRERGPFDADALATVGIQLARALTAVHAANLVHRDIKPQNVMRDGTGRIVLGDFGIGLHLEDVASAGHAGTPLYLAPEIYAGRAATPQTDIYALGVLLYHLATGAYPVGGDTVAAIRAAHAKGQRTRLSDVRGDLPVALTSVIDRALDADPQRRLATAADVETALTFDQGSFTRTPASPSPRSRAVVTLLALTVVVAASAAWMLRRDSTSTGTADASSTRAAAAAHRSSPGRASPAPTATDAPAAPGVIASSSAPPASVTAPMPAEATRTVGALPARDRLSLTQIPRDFQRGFRIAAGTTHPDLLTCFDLTDQAIALCNLADDTIRRVRPPLPGERVLTAVLSPDGRRIAYTVERQGTAAVRIVGIDGEGDREILAATGATSFGSVQWLSGRPGLLVGRREAAQTASIITYLAMGEDGSGPTALWRFENPDARGIDPSPDGRFIAFDRLGAAGNRELAIADTTTRAVSAVASDGNNDVRPMWTPDGSAIVFQSDRRARRGLYVVRVADGVAVSEPAFVLDVTRGQTTQVTYAGADTLVLQRMPHWYNGFRVGIDLASGRADSPRPIDARTVTEEMPGVTLSSDGAFIAYIAGALGDVTRAHPRVVVLQRDGRMVREMPLTGTLTRRSRVRWSRDGRHIAVLSQSDRKPVIELFDTLSGASLGLIDAAGTFDIRFDATDQGILSAAGQELRRYDLSSKTTAVYYRAPVPFNNNSTFDVARDGSLLVPLMNGVHIVRPDGRVLRRFSFPGGQATALAWSSDGSRIVASGITTDPARAVVVVMDAESGAPTSLAIDAEPIFDLAVAPDDSELVISAGNQAPQYWLLRHFLP